MKLKKELNRKEKKGFKNKYKKGKDNASNL